MKLAIIYMVLLPALQSLTIRRKPFSAELKQKLNSTTFPRRLQPKEFENEWGDAFFFHKEKDGEHVKHECANPPAEVEDQYYCKLSICKSGGKKKARLIIDYPHDGEGHRMVNLIEGLMMARANGMDFGGALISNGAWMDKHRWEMSDHQGQDGIHQNATEILFKLFDIKDPSSLLLFDTPPCMDKVWHWEFDSRQTMDTERAALKEDANVYLPLVQDHWWPLYEKDRADFMAELRKPMLSMEPTFFKDSKMPVAIHVRRGDRITSKEAQKKDDDYILGQVDRILKVYPSADIHLWSSLENKGIWKESDFDIYKKKRYHCPS